MRSRLRRPSPAMVVACLALFVALGGSAMAAFVVSSNSQIGPNTIYGANRPSTANDNIVNGSITASDIKQESIGGNRIINGSLTGPDVAANTLKGTQIDESTLAKVPAAAQADNASTLDGLDSTALIQGQGRIATIDATIVKNDGADILDLPGFVKVFYNCNGTGSSGAYNFVTDPSNAVTVMSDNGGPDPSKVVVPADTSEVSSLWNTNPAGDALTFSLEATGTKVATLVLFSYAFHNGIFNQDRCVVQGQAIEKG